MNVEELLIKQDVPYIPKGADFEVSCLNPDHPDRNPSMRIDRITGIFNCFSCEFKGNLFTLFGEKPNQLQLQREKLKNLIKQKMAESTGLALPSQATPKQAQAPPRQENKCCIRQLIIFINIFAGP